MKSKIISIILTAFLPLLASNLNAQNNDFYQSKWNKINKLEAKGKEESALKLVNEVLEQSKTENNFKQVIKSFIFKVKYEKYLHLNTIDGFCNELDSLATKANFPYNAIMYSMVADMYIWEYEKTYRYKDLTTFTSNDILIRKIIEFYSLSLKNKEELGKIKITDYKEFINLGTIPISFQPTLYDFIANKAIDFYSNQKIHLSKQEALQFKDKSLFDDADLFIKQNLCLDSTLSLHYHAQLLIQDLLKFRLKNIQQKEALIIFDLKRLNIAYEYSLNNNKDELYLNALQRLEEKYNSNPASAEVSYKIAESCYNLSSKYNLSDQKTKKYRKYRKQAWEYCHKVLIKYPETYAAKYCKELKAEIERKNLNFVMESVQAPNSPFAIKVNYRNTKKIYLRIGKIQESKFIKLSWKPKRKAYKKIKKNVLIIDEFSYDLPVDSDFYEHSVELIMKKLPVGFYVVFISDNKEYSYENAINSYLAFNVSNISFVNQIPYNDSSYFVVLNRTTGQPLQNVQCQTWKSRYRSSGKEYKKNGVTGITNKYGNFVAAPVSYGRYDWNVDFSAGNDKLSTYILYRSRWGHNKGINVKTYLFTDRGIYRPGQTINFKGINIIQFGEINTIATDHETTVELYDVNNQKLDSLKVSSNEFGSFSGSFIIPTGLLNGSFKLVCNNDSKEILVEEYKRSQFEVSILPNDKCIKFNENIEIEGSAVSFSGIPISSASVNYRITCTPYSVNDEEQENRTTIEIKRGDLLTDYKGHFKISCSTKLDSSFTSLDFDYCVYTFEIDVIDENGETQSASTDIYIDSCKVVEIDLSIPEFINKNDQIYDDKNTSMIDIECYSSDYQDVEVKGEVRIYKLKDMPVPLRPRLWEKPDKSLYSKEEWYRLFPGNVFNNEDVQPAKDKEVLATSIDTKLNRKFDLSCVKNFETGRYVAEINAVDTFGNKLNNTRYFSVYNDMENKMPYHKIDLFIPVNTLCKPGDSAKFIVGSSKENIHLIFQIEHRNKIVSTEFIQLNNEQKLISIPVTDKHQGNFSVHFLFIKDNRLYRFNSLVEVPYLNKRLNIEFQTFRDKLYPNEKEQWRIKVKDSKGKIVNTEMLATLYDASLDKIKENTWDFNIYKLFDTQLFSGLNCFFTVRSHLLYYNYHENDLVRPMKYPAFDWNNAKDYYNYHTHFFRDIDWWGWLSFGGGLRKMADKAKSPSYLFFGAPEKIEEVRNDVGMNEEDQKFENLNLHEDEENQNNEGIDVENIRTNFNETAFFYPHLRSNEEGEVVVEFTVPESLTKWKMMGLATTKDLKYGYITNELVTKKDLMLIPNAPRFFREDDKITFPVKITNNSSTDLSGKVRLELLDILTMKPIKEVFQEGESETKEFELKSRNSKLVNWQLKIPKGIEAIMYKVVAKAGEYSDGEQKPIPVIKNSILVTEALPWSVNGSETKTYNFNKLINSVESNTLKHHNVTLEFTSNPAWYAIQALPYIMEYPYECTEQTFSRFYANSIATHIANSNPKIKKVFENWKNIPKSEALLSHLEKNQELKSVLLEETPWVMAGKDESEKNRHIGLLFDLDRMANEMKKTLDRIQKTQEWNGAWPWFEGMPESRYITQYIVAGMGHLDKLGVKTIIHYSKTWNMIRRAVGYIDIQIKEDYDELKKHNTTTELKENHLSYAAIQYLYARSYFKDLPIPAKSKKAFLYYMQQAKDYWSSQNKYMQGMLALALNRYKVDKIPYNILQSLKDSSVIEEELGMYWKDNVSGYYWYQAPIEMQALMIEVFDEVGKDQQAVNDLKLWLLKQKQNQDWKTTKATSEAIYALLLRGSDWLESDNPLEIKMGDIIIDPKKKDNVKVEAGTGYFKTSWGRGEIEPEMGNVTITKSEEGVSWGAIYWQYFEQPDKITPHETPLKLKKQLFIEKLTEMGEIMEPISEKNQPKIGDIIIVRIELCVDRQMEYIHMKDMRASGFEPLNVISTYKRKDGLVYYESTKDAATNFFIEELPKGTYVFEYPLWVTHQGDFSNGITTIQCMYAPEFTSHSEGIRVEVEK